ncbi:hypothetical protein KEJ32_07185, partial [Candidatus Bathyarchaeota archaeon]|nr:hypothetical protein [Candidatus Bathyarchaeota archaeon]
VVSEGYILRIAKKEWIERVFDSAMYYTGVRRRWKIGQTILFLSKTELGDSFIGYGIIERVYEKEELSDEERKECEKYGWQKAIEFKYLIRFEKPLPIKETFVKDLRLCGKTLHGLPLKAEQLESIISQARS